MNFVFDVDDTLYDQMALFTDAFTTVFQNRYAFDLLPFYISTRKHSEDVFDDVVAGRMSLDECGIYRISKAFAEYGIEVDREEALAVQRRYFANQQCITLEEDKRLLLQWLKERKITRAVLTNGPAEHQRRKVEQLGLSAYFAEENIFVSGEIGVSKPDAEAFAIVRDALHLDLAKTYYIGDSLENDVIGAKKAGWKVIWINRRDATLPDDFAYMPDHIICRKDSLQVLMERLLQEEKEV